MPQGDVRYLVITDLTRVEPIAAVKVVKELLKCELHEALRISRKEIPWPLVETLNDIAHIEKELAWRSIEFRILDGLPKRLNKCCICDSDTVREWMSYDLFGDPEDAEKFGGQPFCQKCWKSISFERFTAIVEPPTSWERLGGVWDDE